MCVGRWGRNARYVTRPPRGPPPAARKDHDGAYLFQYSDPSQRASCKHPTLGHQAHVLPPPSSFGSPVARVRGDTPLDVPTTTRIPPRRLVSLRSHNLVP